MEDLPKSAQIYLFGAGAFGRNLLKELRSRRPDIQILGFIDSVRTESLEGLPVCALDQASGYDAIIPATPCWHGMGVAMIEHGIEDFLLVEAERSMVYSVVRTLDNKLMYSICSRTGSSSLIRAMRDRHFRIPEVVGEKTDDDPAYSFTVVRNPFNRVVSCYHGHFGDTPSMLGQNVLRLMGKESLSFKKFVEWLDREPNWAKDNHLRPFSMIIPAWIDHVGRLENLGACIEHLHTVTGVELEVEKIFSSKRKHKDYKPYYTDDLKRIVEKVYAEDLDRFGYSF